MSQEEGRDNSFTEEREQAIRKIVDKAIQYSKENPNKMPAEMVIVLEIFIHAGWEFTPIWDKNDMAIGLVAGNEEIVEYAEFIQESIDI